jgi:uncharacterized iron-regulated membrane protein
VEAASAQESEDTMWQGYVSVISCLLLALLLIMAILAIALVLSSAAEKAQSEPPMPAPTATAPPATAPPATAPPATAPKATAPPATKPSSPGQAARWAINFPGQTVDIAPAQRAQFAAQLNMVSPEGNWQVFAYSEPGNSSAQRLAYIRVLATRDLLIESGVSAKNIELQLLDTDPALTRSPTANAQALATEGKVFVKPGSLQAPANVTQKGQP